MKCYPKYYKVLQSATGLGNGGSGRDGFDGRLKAEVRAEGNLVTQNCSDLLRSGL